jgi:D-glycero-D-manno-heptose 1,7-bisphosphate phosphatase
LTPSTGAVYVDRDGVLNDLVRDPRTGRPESPLRVSDVRLLPNAGRQLARLQRAGWKIACVTNQPAAAKAIVTEARLEAVHDRVVSLLGADGGTIDVFRMCRHHPEGVVSHLRGSCDCRKPAPGMLLSIAEELSLDLAGSWLVGDTDTDVEAAHAAGVRPLLLANPKSAHKRSRGLRTLPDLEAAVDVILENTTPAKV